MIKINSSWSGKFGYHLIDNIYYFLGYHSFTFTNEESPVDVICCVNDNHYMISNLGTNFEVVKLISNLINPDWEKFVKLLKTPELIKDDIEIIYDSSYLDIIEDKLNVSLGR